MVLRKLISFRIFLVISPIIIFLFGCQNKNNCDSIGYELEHPITIYPVQDSFFVGDTIWIEMDISDVFQLWWYDSTKNTFAKLENFDFARTYFIIYGLEDQNFNMSLQPYRWSNFDFIIYTGQKLTDSPGGIWYKMAYQLNKYKFKAALVCNEPGYYSFRSLRFPMYPDNDNGLNYQDITPECEDRELITRIYYPINRQENAQFDNNYHIYGEAFQQAPIGYSEQLLRTEHFHFKVVE